MLGKSNNALKSSDFSLNINNEEQEETLPTTRRPTIKPILRGITLNDGVRVNDSILEDNTLSTSSESLQRRTTNLSSGGSASKLARKSTNSLSAQTVRGLFFNFRIK